MPWSQGWPITAAQRVAVVNTPGVGPFDFRGGFRFDSTGALVIGSIPDTTAPGATENGLAFSGGFLVTVLQDSPLPAHDDKNGLPRVANLSQAIYCTTISAIASFVNGLPIGVNGALCVAFSPPV